MNTSEKPQVHEDYNGKFTEASNMWDKRRIRVAEQTVVARRSA
jgi:hypothetical protein